jgi:hypothetical protein
VAAGAWTEGRSSASSASAFAAGDGGLHAGPSRSCSGEGGEGGGARMREKEGRSCAPAVGADRREETRSFFFYTGWPGGQGQFFSSVGWAATGKGKVGLTGTGGRVRRVQVKKVKRFFSETPSELRFFFLS